MRLVIKKKKEDAFLKCDYFSNVSFQEFSRNMDKYSKAKLQELYVSLFGKPCTNIIWAKYQIHYELARQLYIQNEQFDKLWKGAIFRKHYEGTMSENVNQTGETIRSAILIELNKSILPEFRKTHAKKGTLSPKKAKQ